MATVSGWTLVERAVRRMGGITGTIAAGPTTTTAVLSGLINTTLDDSYLAGSPLFFPDGTASPDYTTITQWDDSAGQATYPALSVAPTATNRYAVQLRGSNYTLREFEEALSKALTYGRRTYRQVIATTPFLELYPLSELDWLEGAGSVDAVWWSNSPLQLHNEDFALWQNGAAAAPDGWTLSGSGASVARVTGGIRSAYGAQVTAGGEATAILSQAIPKQLMQWITRRTFPIFIQQRGGAWVQTSDASSVRVGIYDGTTTTYSDYIDADGVPQFPSLSVTPTADMTTFELRLECAAGTTATWWWASQMQNTLGMGQASQVKDRGSQAYGETPYTHAVRNIGQLPTVDLRSFPGTYGQLIVYSRRPFPELTDLDDVFEDQYARALEAGLLTFLLDNIKPNQDRGRLDRILDGDARIGETGERQRWVSFLQDNVSIPVQAPMNVSVIRGA